MTFDLKDILNQLTSASLEDLKKLAHATEKELQFRESTDLVDYIPDCLDPFEKDLVFSECESMNFGNCDRKAGSKWLSSTKEPYVFTDSNPVHKAVDIKEFPAICRAMASFNKRFNTNNNACLVLKYTTSTSTTRLHADDEPNLDPSQPICNLTIGSSRVIKFLTKSGKKEVCSIDMMDNGVVLMKPGCQNHLLHKVQGDNLRANALRYSLSFRTLAKEPVSVSNAGIVSIAPLDNTAAVSNKVITKHVNLVCGDSYANRLDSQKLGKRRFNVENVARGGAQIHQVMGQLRAFAEANPATVVEKVFISVGTNDIRYCPNIAELKPKLKSLCALTRELFPKSRIYFQSLIPLPCKSSNDWVTNRKVIDFNRMLVNECIFRRFHVLDAFSVFCSPFVDPSCPEIRNQSLFNGSDIHPSKNRGMGALAKLYIRALHSRYFDPFILQ
jgi:alkylated DNA repair dioxygenase AlkB